MSIRRLSILLAAALTAACSSEPTGPIASVNAARGADDAGVVSAASGSTATRTEIKLAGSSAFAAAKGKARFKVSTSGRELQVEIENVRAGTMVNFFVGGVQYGTTQTVSALGAARIDLSTQLGQSVPASVTGASVQVKTAAGALVASGSF